MQNWMVLFPASGHVYMIPGVTIIDRKASIASAKGAVASGGSNKDPDWLKIDLNAAKVYTAQNYKRTKKLM